ncbi:MAG: TolC family protein [Bacteroidales bacterium]|jgi:outer membrane protein TolC
MNRVFAGLIIPAILVQYQKAFSQEVKKLTLDEVIKIAEDQSPNALMAKNQFQASYWEFRSYQAQFRPSLSLNGTLPGFMNAPERVYKNGEFQFVQVNEFNNLGTLSLAQSIGFSGTTISLYSKLEHTYNFDTDLRQYDVNPFNIEVDQPIRKYNTLRWQTKTEPLKYETAKKTFLSNIEGVHSSAIQNFFALALAQINKEIAVMDLSNADTLYRIAKGRYNLGTIAEEDLLQMQLSYLNAETEIKQADMNLRDKEIRLRSFLGYNEGVRIELVLPDKVPDLQVSTSEVLNLAMQNNPEILNERLTILTAQSNVAQAKALKGLNASLSAVLGYDQSASAVQPALNDLLKTETINLTFSVPILDWGKGKGNYLMALSNLKLAQVQEQQALVDFQQNLFLDVEQFNLQKEQVEIAAKSDTVAMRMFEVAKQRFMIGKIAILDLNNADSQKTLNRVAYVQALENYWTYFYTIRSLTLYDFIKREPIETDYEKLLK